MHKLQVSTDENGKPKREVYGDLARCRIEEIQWLINAPFGEYKRRYASLVKTLKDRDKAEAKTKKSNGGLYA